MSDSFAAYAPPDTDDSPALNAYERRYLARLCKLRENPKKAKRQLVATKWILLAGGFSVR